MVTFSERSSAKTVVIRTLLSMLAIVCFGWPNPVAMSSLHGQSTENEEFRARFGTTAGTRNSDDTVAGVPPGQQSVSSPEVPKGKPAESQTQQQPQPQPSGTPQQQPLPQNSQQQTGELRRTELNDTRNGQWQQAAGAAGNGEKATGNAAEEPREITRASRTFESLPSSAGQVWREYDIQPYTSQVSGTDRPEQALVEWLLLQTGKEMWFHQPFGFMNASREKLFVYHTPEIHNQIRPLLDRMIASRGQSQVIDVGLYSVGNPNWRAAAVGAMQPIQVNSPGVEAWVTSKENAARIISQIQSRGDFKSHAAGRAIIHNGQKFELERKSPEQFIRAIQWTPGQGAGYQPLMTRFDEGYSISISPLTTLDSRNIEVMVKCSIDQIEKQTTVTIPVTDTSGMNQKINVQVPQIVSWRLEERVLWPVDQVLVLGCGVVATPDSRGGNRPLGGLFEPGSGRADALLFIDYRGPSAERPGGNNIANGLAPIRK